MREINTEAYRTIFYDVERVIKCNNVSTTIKETASIKVDKNGNIKEYVTTDNSGCGTMNPSEILDSILNKIKFKLAKDDVDEQSCVDDIFGELYQLFGSSGPDVYLYLATYFKQCDQIKYLRIFENLPDSAQLESVRLESCNDKQHYFIMLLSFKHHFITGICINGNFLAFDSTRQLENSNGNKNNNFLVINDVQFRLINNKKYQSELTGTCGFWTIGVCVELANINTKNNNTHNNMTQVTYDNIIKKAANFVIDITKRVIFQNSRPINALCCEFKFSINFDKIFNDVKKVGKDGIEISKDVIYKQFINNDINYGIYVQDGYDDIDKFIEYDTKEEKNKQKQQELEKWQKDLLEEEEKIKKILEEEELKRKQLEKEQKELEKNIAIEG